MIRTVDLQTMVNHSPAVEKVSQTAHEGGEHNAQRFALQLSQERQINRSRVTESNHPHGVRDREAREDERKKRRSARSAAVEPQNPDSAAGSGEPEGRLVDIRV